MNKKTVGSIAVDLMSKAQPTTVIDQTRESLTDYEKNVVECVERGKKDFPSQDFYIVVLTKKEKLLENVLRHYFFPRLSCPTPDYDQALYCYKYKVDHLIFMWIIPDQLTCYNIISYGKNTNKGEEDLFRFVHLFRNGELFKIAKDLNKEKEDSLELRDVT